MYELKSCQFCGLPAEFYPSSHVTDSDKKTVIFRFYVGCGHCNRFPPDSDGKIVFTMSKDGNLKILIDEREKAVEAWNRWQNDGTA